MRGGDIFDGGPFFKGNLHTHSTLSDGRLSPEETCRRYREAGYDFLCLSDHLVGVYGYPVADTRAFRTNAFTTILGAEVHTGAMANGEIWHLLAVGLPTDFERPRAPDFAPAPGAETAAALAARCRDAGAFVAVAHPQWSGLTLADARGIEAAHAVEIYNHGCHVESDRADGTAIFDLLLSEGRRLTAIATDDAHFIGPDHFGGWVMVRADANEPEALLAALKEGRFYATQGPDLRGIAREGDALRVACSPVERVMVLGPGSAATVVRREDFAERADGPDGTDVARLPLGRMARAPWLRVVAADAQGRRVWSNPLWAQ
jgi:predicted metal-dependent phosphoesterase TrpH